VRNIITFPSGIVKKKHQGMTAFRPSQEEFDKGKKTWLVVWNMNFIFPNN
jgi:hypothetical protein